MPSDKVLDEVEASIEMQVEQPKEQEDLAFDELKDRIEKREFPVGPADSAAFVDFGIYALAAPNIYAIPYVGDQLTGHNEGTAGILVALYNLSLEKMTVAQADKAWRTDVANLIAGTVNKIKGSNPMKFLSTVANIVADFNPADQ